MNPKAWFPSGAIDLSSAADSKRSFKFDLNQMLLLPGIYKSHLLYRSRCQQLSITPDTPKQRLSTIKRSTALTTQQEPASLI